MGFLTNCTFCVQEAKPNEINELANSQASVPAYGADILMLHCVS